MRTEHIIHICATHSLPTIHLYKFIADAQAAFSDYAILDRFLAIASSTALNCFNNSSRRVVFVDDDEDDAFAVAVVPADGLVSGITAGERFFDVSTFLLVTDFLSIDGLSLERGAFLTTVRRAVLDELLELDEYDDPDSEPLESEEPESVELDLLLRLSLVAGLRD